MFPAVSLKKLLNITDLDLFRWQTVSNNLYKYSLDYEADGVGDNLFKDFRLKLDLDPRSVTFLIL